MHDTKGFPIECFLTECYKNKLTPCLGQFVCDAIEAWGANGRERAIKIVRSALLDQRSFVPSETINKWAAMVPDMDWSLL